MNQKNIAKRIAIVGAGLGGLTAAGFLQRAGFAVKVYEQAPAFSRIGAGIILSANVCKVLRRLGLEEGLIAAGIKSQSYVSRAWDTGEVMAEFIFDAEHERLYGGPYVHIHRGDLHAVLERGVTPGTIAFNHQLVDLRENGGATQLVFANGATAEADVVIGADGIRSKVREILLGPEPPQFVGAVAYRAIFPAARLNGLYIPDCTKWWGIDRHCLPYYLTGRRDEVYAIGVVPAENWEHGDTSIPATREQYLESFAGFHSDLQRVLQAVDTVTLWPVFDRERDDRWSGGAKRQSRAAGRRLPSDAAVHGGGRRHGGRGRGHPRSLPRKTRRSGGSIPLLRGDTHSARRQGAGHLDRQHLDARPDRHRVVLLL